MVDSSHQLEQFEDIRKPQFRALGHVLKQEMPRIRGDLISLDRTVLGME
ncbi:hypothetical protein HAP47_0020965 [Bradyrhizobium sp. 41S5]|nr:hypothetical protein [Bradyrhizobium sp. 41S5]UFX41777.1 hypothetical protein HAP47_0020965 [Bradyrhizobium sp. 41S5]